jgi:hypothetical protein
MTETQGGHPRDLLSSYLDDELGVEDRLAIDRHLADCEDCRAELDGLRKLARSLADESVPPPPVDLLAKIGRGLDASTKQPVRRFRYALPATIAATLGAVGILVALQWREGRLGAPAAPTLPASAAPVAREPAEPAALAAPKVERDAVDDLKTVNAPAPSPTSRDRVEPRKLQDVSRSDAPEKKKSVSYEPLAMGQQGEPIGKSYTNVITLKTAGQASGEAGGALPAPAAKLDVSSPCENHWSDSGVHGRWDVTDIVGAGQVLQQIAREGGGVGIEAGIVEGRPYVLAVPPDRFEGVLQALRARGVAGLDEPQAATLGDGCAGISVALVIIAPPPPPSPR